MSDDREFEHDENVSRDEILVGLLEKVTTDLRRGHHPDVEKISRDHPELMDELQKLLGVVFVTEEMARSGSQIFESTVLVDLEDGPRSSDPTPAVEAIGDFKIVEELGRGGMGVVFKAEQRTLERTVALKALLRGPLASSQDMARFRLEAQSAARLDHPNIVPVYEVGEHEGQPYFTMRYVQGETLAQRLVRGPIASKEAAHLVLTVAQAIHHAHQQGVLHRDLKPSNILLDQNDVPHVADFGLAKRLEAGESMTQTGAILGSPSYMAPEQAAGSRGTIDSTTDVYGLGAVLYHMLTGRPPFQATTPIDTVLAVLEQEPLPPRLLQPRVDRDLELIALKCLQKPQDLRYESAEELAKDLRAYLDGDTIAARSTNVLQIVTRLFRETHHADILENWGLLWMLHSAALLALCLLTNYFQWRGMTSPQPYIALWTFGLGAWAFIFWTLRRRAGPITFVERQIAHLWGAAILSSIFLFLVEIVMHLEVLTLSPVLALISASVFLAKASILSGVFYVQAGCMFLMSLVMAYYRDFNLTLFGFASAACFFIPGLKYYRQRGKKTRG